MMKTNWLAIEALVCSIPCVLAAMGGFPIFLYAAFRMLSYDPGEAAYGFLFVFGMSLALFQYFVLASRTIRRAPYPFGLGFLLAAGSSLYGLWWAGRSFGLTTTAIMLGPIVAATLHFMALQIRRRRSPQ